MSIKIKAKLFWAQLNEVNDMTGKYQVDLANLSKDAVKELTSLGIRINSREGDEYERGSYITCKSIHPIKAIDSDGVPIDTDVRIGNGSDAIAIVTPYNWEFKGKKGVSASLGTLVVSNLITYETGIDSLSDGNVY